MNWARIRVSIVLAIGIFLSFASTHGGDDNPLLVDFDQVLAFDVDSSEGGGQTLIADDQGGREASTSFTVTLRACEPEVLTNDPGNLAYHDRCRTDAEGLSSSADGLTATGTLQIRAERIVRAANGAGSVRLIELLGDVPIGPLAFGESQSTEAFSYRFTAEEPPIAGYAGGSGSKYTYQIAARLTCTVGGSACGSGSDALQLNVVPTDAPEPSGTGRLVFEEDRGSYPGEFTSVSDANLELQQPNRIEIVIADAGDRFTGSFELGWIFSGNPESPFVTTGSISGVIDGSFLRGEFVLDDPEASYLEYALGTPGQFSAFISDDGSMSGGLIGDSITLEFEVGP
jgi:hypothetical protein